MKGWRKDAECVKQGIPVEVFIHDPELPDHEVRVAAAKEVCRECPVRADCFLAGVNNNETGVWGGAWLDVLPDSDSSFS